MGVLLDEALKVTKSFLSFNSLDGVTKDGVVYKIWTCMGCQEKLFLTSYEKGTKEERTCDCGARSRISFYKNGKIVRRLIK